MEVRKDDVDEEENEIWGERMFWGDRIGWGVKMDEMDEQEEGESG